MGLRGEGNHEGGGEIRDGEVQRGEWAMFGKREKRKFGERGGREGNGNTRGGEMGGGTVRNGRR